MIDFDSFPLKRNDNLGSWVDLSEREQNVCIASGIVPLDYPEHVAKDWPELLSIVERRVKPERQRSKDALGVKFGGGSAPTRRALCDCLATRLPPVLVARFAAIGGLRLQTGMIYADSIVLFTFSKFASFAMSSVSNS